MGNVFDVDFVVVGAGMAGASVAAHLSTHARVALLDMEEHAGYHSTGRSAALFSEMYGNALIRGLTRASRQFFFEPPGDFAPTPLVSPRQTLYFGRPDQLEALQRFRTDPDIRTSTVELTGPETLKHLPIFRDDYLGGGALEAGSADLDVDAIHQGFLRLVLRHKSTIQLSTPVEKLTWTDRSWVVTTSTGVFRAPVVINASGAWGDEVALLAGVVPIGLQPMRRTAVLIPTPGGLTATNWPAAIDISEQFYFKPDAGLLLLSPADEQLTAPCDAQPEELDVAIAIDRFEQATGSEVRQVRRRWAGLRVFSPDRSPVVGFDPAAEGFFWLVGQGGYGIQTAPALGRTAAALATSKPIPPDVAAMGVTAAMLSRARFLTSH